VAAGSGGFHDGGLQPAAGGTIDRFDEIPRRNTPLAGLFEDVDGTPGQLLFPVDGSIRDAEPGRDPFI